MLIQTNFLGSRVVRIELFTARVLCRASYRILKYSTDTGSGYELHRVAQSNRTPGSSFQFVIQQQRLEMCKVKN